MLGKKFRLAQPVRAVHARDGQKGFVLLPEGAVLRVDSEHDDNRIVRVSWESRELLVFAEDLVSRGVELASKEKGEARAQHATSPGT